MKKLIALLLLIFFSLIVSGCNDGNYGDINVCNNDVESQNQTTKSFEVKKANVQNKGTSVYEVKSEKTPNQIQFIEFKERETEIAIEKMNNWINNNPHVKILNVNKTTKSNGLFTYYFTYLSVTYYTE